MSDKSMNDARPLSPHLQVYRLPLTAILSITHRLSGLALALGAAVLVLVLFAAGAGEKRSGPLVGRTGTMSGEKIHLRHKNRHGKSGDQVCRGK